VTETQGNVAMSLGNGTSSQDNVPVTWEQTWPYRDVYFIMRNIMTKQQEELPLDIDKITQELTSLHVEFIQQVEEHMAKNNDVITLDEIEKIYSIYYDKREKIIQFTYNYFRSIVLRNIKHT
jgi:hypothetical protein